MALTKFTTTIDDRYLEDYPVGAIYEFGETKVSENDIISYAKQFDPQSFHIDPVKAKEGPFKGLIASGFHTISLAGKLYIDNFLSHNASLGSPGMDEIRWLRPVRPGDTLRQRVTVLESRLSKSKNDRGTLILLVESINQSEEIVMSFKIMSMLLKRS